MAAKVPLEECRVSTLAREPPNQSIRAGKRSLHSIWQQEPVRTLSTGKRRESIKIPGALLKGHCTGTCPWLLPWGFGRGKITQGIQES